MTTVDFKAYNSQKAFMSDHPTIGHGKICYLEIPAGDVDASANFYKAVFNWNVRTRGDGSAAFDDGVCEVSGTWIAGRSPQTDPVVIMHIMVDDMDASIEKVKANGGTIVEPVGAHLPEITAKFSDPHGNVFSMYQHGGRK